MALDRGLLRLVFKGATPSFPALCYVLFQGLEFTLPCPGCPQPAQSHQLWEAQQGQPWPILGWETTKEGRRLATTKYRWTSLTWKTFGAALSTTNFTHKPLSAWKLPLRKQEVRGNLQRENSIPVHFSLDAWQMLAKSPGHLPFYGLGVGNGQKSSIWGRLFCPVHVNIHKTMVPKWEVYWSPLFYPSSWEFHLEEERLMYLNCQRLADQKGRERRLPCTKPDWKWLKGQTWTIKQFFQHFHTLRMKGTFIPFDGCISTIFTNAVSFDALIWGHT